MNDVKGEEINNQSHGSVFGGKFEVLHLSAINGATKSKDPRGLTVPNDTDSKGVLDKPYCVHPHTIQAKVFYLCTVEECPLRHSQEVYCVSCAQSLDGGHKHDHVYMRHNYEYLQSYRDTQNMVSAVSDTSSVVSGESSQDSSDFAMEWEAVLYQRRLAKEGRSHEIRLTPM